MVQRDFVRERQVQSCYTIEFSSLFVPQQVQPKVVFCKYCSSIVPDAPRCEYCGANDRWKT